MMVRYKLEPDNANIQNIKAIKQYMSLH